MRWTVLFLLAILACWLPIAGQSTAFVSLVPSGSLTELWIIEGTPPDTWSLRDGVIACKGTPNGFLRSKKSYRNYVLRAEWRFETKGWHRGPNATTDDWPNAGFFIHAGAIDRTWPKSLEVQGHYGEAGSLFGVRGGSIRGAKRGPIVKDLIPFGEWDRYEITSLNGTVKVVLNGVPVNEGSDAEPSEGNICLQSEGWPVSYRRVEIKELP
jgi:hypothetical protein